MNKKIVGIIAGVIVVAAIVIIVSSKGSKTPDTAAPVTTAQDQTTAPASVSSTTTTVTITVDTQPSSVKEFTVVGDNFSFAPSTMKVKKGDTVKITFKNNKGFHDFRIDEFNVATKQMGGGKQETVQFVATKTGSFEYYCSVGEHRAMGMKGTLIVE